MQSQQMQSPQQMQSLQGMMMAPPQQQQANYAMLQSNMMNQGMQQQPSSQPLQIMGNNSKVRIISNILDNLQYEAQQNQ
jgi:hypothetical protein